MLRLIIIIAALVAAFMLGKYSARMTTKEIESESNE